jgi:hypothetical protein
MQLSVCLLTRDAEPKIERALASVMGLGVEVIVGDTGSTDRTVELARARGATVHVLPWNDDFGAAQNAILDQASGDWVLWLNPDEELLPDGEETLATMLANPHALAYLLRVQEIQDPKQIERAIETLQTRLYRRGPDVRYIGRLHPHFTVPLEQRAGQVPLAALTILHHAYLSSPTPEKIRWSTRLLELELKDRPGQLHYLIEYGRNLLRLDDARGHEVLAEAAEQVLALADAPRPSTPTVGSLLEYVLTVAPKYSRSRLGREQARTLALRWFPMTPPVLWAVAMVDFHEGRCGEAAELLERLLQLGHSGDYDRAAAFDPAIMAEPALLNLGRCYARLNDFARAEACFGQLIAHPRHGDEARRAQAIVQAARQRAAVRTAASSTREVAGIAGST